MKEVKTVAVGLSGGIDSAMAALLLKQAGYQVVGLTMQIWDGSVALGEHGRSGCYGPGEAQDLEEAASVAKRLGIEHRIIALASEYKAEVLEYFRREYLAGRTPNPCVRCNQQIKFGFLLSRAREQGIVFDLFATGHYARVNFSSESGRFLLLRGVDPRKDQSYFLARLKQQQLSQLLFPLGELSKDQVREKAHDLGWKDLLTKPESQDFIESDDYGVLFDQNEVVPGPMIDQFGNLVGQHRGLIHYTIGQRRGVAAGGFDQPQYVTGIDGTSNTVKIGGKEGLYSDVLIADDLNWIAQASAPKEELPVLAKIRLAHKPAAAILRPDKGSDEVVVTFEQPQCAITPGQTVVFYQDDVVLGSGVIKQRGGVDENR